MLHGATEEGMLCTDFRAQVEEMSKFHTSPSTPHRPTSSGLGFGVWGFGFKGAGPPNRRDQKDTPRSLHQQRFALACHRECARSSR